MCFVIYHSSTHVTHPFVLACQCSMLTDYDLEFSELNPDGRNLTAYKTEMVWMFLHSVEGPLFPPTPHI